MASYVDPEEERSDSDGEPAGKEESKGAEGDDEEDSDVQILKEIRKAPAGKRKKK